MLAMKFCCAQLRHQNGTMTARPHAARVTCTGSQKIAWNVLTQVPSVSSWSKQYKSQQLDKQLMWEINSHSPRPSQRQMH